VPGIPRHRGVGIRQLLSQTKVAPGQLFDVHGEPLVSRRHDGQTHTQPDGDSKQNRDEATGRQANSTLTRRRLDFGCFEEGVRTVANWVRDEEVWWLLTHPSTIVRADLGRKQT